MMLQYSWRDVLPLGVMLCRVTRRARGHFVHVNDCAAAPARLHAGGTAPTLLDLDRSP
jgi:hypothetical protein